MLGMHGTGRISLFPQLACLLSFGGKEDCETCVGRLVSLFLPKLSLSPSLNECKFKWNYVGMFTYT